MARGEYTRPKRYGLPEDHEAEAAQRRAAEEYKTREGRKLSRASRLAAKGCNVCGILLSSGTEYRIGVHVRCVYNSDRRARIATIPRPRYGIHK